MSKNNDIQGNANISRNLNVGGHARINGNTVLEHNLVVKGWLDAPNIKGPLKGLYESEETLRRAYPRPMPGWFALVGDTLPAAVWRVDGKDWVPTGETGGEFKLYPDRLEREVAELGEAVGELRELVITWDDVTFEAGAGEVWLCFSRMNADGSRTPVRVAVPMVSATNAGMMSAADKQALSDVTDDVGEIKLKIAGIEEIPSLKEAIGEEIANRRAADNDLQSSIDDLRRSHEDIATSITSAVVEEVAKEVAKIPEAYATVSLAELNGWLAKRPLALRLQGPGQMLRIVENEAVVATAEWYSNYSPEDGECYDGVMRVRGYGIARGTNDSDDMLAYDPAAAPGFMEWEIVDGGDHWEAPVRVGGTGGECGCAPHVPFTMAELDAIWACAAVPRPDEPMTGVFTPEDLDRFWEETTA